MEGKLAGYRYDLVVTLTPEERNDLIILIRLGIAHRETDFRGMECKAVGRTFLRILGVIP